MTDPRRLERETRRLEYELGVATKQLPFLRALVEGTSDLLALVDCDGVILEYNRAFAEALEATLPPLQRPHQDDLQPVPRPRGR